MLQQTITAETTTLITLNVTGAFYLRTTEDAYVGWVDDTDDGNGYPIVADVDYYLTAKNQNFYIYSTAGCTLYVLPQ